MGSVGLTAALVLSCVPCYGFASEIDSEKAVSEDNIELLSDSASMNDENDFELNGNELLAAQDSGYGSTDLEVNEVQEPSLLGADEEILLTGVAVQSESVEYTSTKGNYTSVTTGNKIVLTAIDPSKSIQFDRLDYPSKFGIDTSSPVDIEIADGATKVGKFDTNVFRGITVNSFSMPDSVIEINTSLPDQYKNAPEVRCPSGLVGDGFLYSNLNHTIILRYLESNDGGVLTIPEGAERFSASMKGHSFSEVRIPSTLTRFGGVSLFDEDSVDKVVIAEGNSSFEIDTDPSSATYGSLFKKGHASDDTPYIKVSKTVATYSDDGSTLISVPKRMEGTFVVDEGCTKIDAKAFDGCALLTDIILPSSMLSIGDYAFRDCSSLINMQLPASVSSVGKGIFSGCTSLGSITWPKTITAVPDSTFEGCSKLESFDFDGISSIGKKAFQSCISLASVELPDCVMSLGESSFNGCTGLKKVTLSKNLVQLDNYSDLFDTLITPGGITTIPTAVLGFGDYAFANCTSLENVEAPEGLQGIGRHAFDNCSSLMNFDAPDSLEVIGSGAFSGTGLTSFVAPKNLFANSKLKDLVPNDSSQKTYWDYWFTDDSTASSGGQIFTATDAESLGNPSQANQGVFSQILSLSLTNYSADTIGSYLFSGLNKITTISIPKNVKSIQTGAFFGCSSLKDIYVFNSQCQIAKYSVTTGATGTIYSMPAFGMWSGIGVDGKGILAPLTGVNYYGLAFAQNPLISYAADSDSNFIPFVVLDGADTESLFGNQVAANGAGYNDIRITDVAYTGSEVEPNIIAHFTDRSLNGSLDRQLTVGNGLASVVYKDAAGNTLSGITAPGTYTATITGDESSVFGTKTLTFKVVDSSQSTTPSSQQTGGNLQPAAQQALQQANQVNAAAQQQTAAMPQTGDDAASAAIPATTAAVGALGALGVAIAALRRKFGTYSE